MTRLRDAAGTALVVGLLIGWWLACQLRGERAWWPAVGRSGRA